MAPLRKQACPSGLNSVGAQRDIEGGAASGALPQAGLGRGPMTRTSAPPPARSKCANHALSHGFPFSVADWMYLFCAETFLAVIVKTLPLSSVMRVSSNSGLPIS